MSYDDLRAGIIELFDDAARMSRYQVASGELTLVVGPRRSTKTKTKTPRQPREVIRAHRRERDRRNERKVAQAIRALRIVERERTAWLFPKRMIASVSKLPCYKCRACSSTSSTHRCPG